MPDTANDRLRPTKRTWTHIALEVKDLEATVAWYEKYTHLELLARHESEFGISAWLGDKSQAEAPFILVLSQFHEGKDPFAPVEHAPLAPFNHLGIEVPERRMIDDLAARAKEDGCLAQGPMEMPPPVGYILFLRDPNGNMVEFSHDQAIYETAQRVWGHDETS